MQNSISSPMGPIPTLYLQRFPRYGQKTQGWSFSIVTIGLKRGWWVVALWRWVSGVVPRVVFFIFRVTELKNAWEKSTTPLIRRFGPPYNVGRPFSSRLENGSNFAKFAPFLSFFSFRWHNGDSLISLCIYGIVAYIKVYLKL